MHSRALNKQRMVCGEEATDCLPAPASGCKNSYDDNARLIRIRAKRTAGTQAAAQGGN